MTLSFSSVLAYCTRIGGKYFGDHLVERIGERIVGRERLHRGMELEAFDVVVLDELPGERNPFGAAVRIDAGKGNRDVGILVRELGDLLVGDLSAGALFAVHR